MSTYSFTASGNNIRYHSGSGWASDSSTGGEGKYGSYGSTTYDSRVYLGNLNAINWANQKINKISLNVYLNNAGTGNNNKKLRFLLTNVNGTGSPQLCGFISGLGANGWYNKELTKLTDTEYNAPFTNMCNWLKDKTSSAGNFLYTYIPKGNSTNSEAYTPYYDQDPLLEGKSYTRYYLGFTKFQIIIEYEPAGNNIIVQEPIEIGKETSVTVETVVSESTTALQIDNTNITISNNTITLPYNIVNSMTSTIQTLDGKITTTKDTISLEQLRSFTVKIPDNFLPIINSFTVKEINEGGTDKLQIDVSHSEINYGIYDTSSTANSIKWQVKLGDNTLIEEYGSTTDPVESKQWKWVINPSVYISGSSAIFELKVTSTCGKNSSIVQTISSIFKTTPDEVPLHIAGNNKGIAIGQYSTATDSNPKFECAWPTYLDNGIYLKYNNQWQQIYIDADGFLTINNPTS